MRGECRVPARVVIVDVAVVADDGGIVSQQVKHDSTTGQDAGASFPSPTAIRETCTPSVESPGTLGEMRTSAPQQ